MHFYYSVLFLLILYLCRKCSIQVVCAHGKHPSVFCVIIIELKTSFSQAKYTIRTDAYLKREAKNIPPCPTPPPPPPPRWIVVLSLHGGTKQGVPSEYGTRTNIKLNPYIASTQGIQPRPHWWEASALTTAPSLLPVKQLTFALKCHAVAIKRNRKIQETIKMIIPQNERIFFNTYDTFLHRR